MQRNKRLSEKEDNEMKTLSKQLMSQMVVNDNSSWLKVKKIIFRILEIVPTISSQLAYDIKDQLKKVNSLLTLLLIYNQDIRELRITNSFRQQFITMKSKENFYKNMNKWLTQQPQQTFEAAMELIVENLPTFFGKELTIIKYEDFHFLLTIFNRFKLKSDKEIKIMMNFISQLQKMQLSSMGNLGIKQLALIKIICEVLENDQGTGNLGILFDQALIGFNQSKNIDRFCNIQSEYLLQLSAETLQRIFKSLCKVGINYLILDLIYRTSRILANEQQFYKLASLYQKMILPQIALRAKTCKKSKVDELVLTLTEFYVYGFFVYYKLQKSAIQCLLANIEHIKNQKIQARWVWLCMKAVQKHQQKSIRTFLKEQFSKKGLDQIQISERQFDKVLHQNQIWQISPRNIRNLKKYNYENSLDLKGIINHSCQCYIISIVQALFMTVSLSRIIEKARPRQYGFRAIDNLNNLFNSLSNDSKKLPSVDRLKKDGPEYFSQSQRQQDAQNYLIILLQQFQEQFKKQKLLQEFKKIFQIETKDIIVCKSCKNQKEITQYQYARTFAHGEQFVLERSQDLIDYKCDKCGKKDCIKNTAITLKSDIAILHINRFSSKGGTSKKELPTQKIKRRINNYELVGMVFHIGKNMQSGHYTYFTRISKKRWAEMNDTQVFQFNLNSQDEEFQKQFKAWKTPYILFYKKER